MSMLRHLLFATTAVVGAACAQVIDLGDEATLREDTASGGSGGGAGSPGGGAGSPGGGAGSPGAGGTGGTGSGGNPCGIPPSASPTCNACWETNCCPEAQACAAEPQCLAGNTALEECLYDIQCVVQANTDYADAPGFTEFSGCIAVCGTACMPTGDCLALAQCCQQISEQFLRDACYAIISGEDQAECLTRLTDQFSQYCPN